MKEKKLFFSFTCEYLHAVNSSNLSSEAEWKENINSTPNAWREAFNSDEENEWRRDYSYPVAGGSRLE
jgi:hypothetical protein